MSLISTCVVLMRSSLLFSLSSERKFSSTFSKAAARYLVRYCAPIKGYTAFAKRAEQFIVHTQSLEFEYCLADTCVLRVPAEGHVSITAVVHVADVFTSRHDDRFCQSLNCLVAINNLGDILWYAGCRYRGGPLLTTYWTSMDFANKGVKPLHGVVRCLTELLMPVSPTGTGLGGCLAVWCGLEARRG